MSKRRTRTTLVVAFVVMGVAVLGLAAAVYAKYIASITDKTASAQVAAWAFKEDNESTELTCPLEKTYDADTLVAKKIAPGTKGTCVVTLSNENSEVGVAYTVKVTDKTGPANLVFKYNGNEIPAAGITGTLTPGQTGQEVKIDWEWPYYTSAADDDEDTNDGRTAAEATDADGEKTMDVTFAISGYQVQPTE